MTMPENFERTVKVWLRDEAERPFPDQLDALLERSVATRQRRWWSSPERWLPMDTTFTGRVAPTMRLARPIVITALLLIALVAALLVAGSRAPHLSPYGPAMPGLTAVSEGGDIALIDPVTGRRSVVTAGPEWDVSPGFSPDGTKLAFGRGTSENGHYASVMVANADGSDLKSVTQPILDIGSGEWSGDGAYIAITSANVATASPDDQMLTIIDVGSGSSRVLDVGMSVESAGWIPPLGQELVFRGLDLVRPDAVYAIRPDGIGLRQLTPRDGVPGQAYQGPKVSPDGTLLAYQTWQSLDRVMGVFVRSLVDGSIVRIPSDTPTSDLYLVDFSPDGKSLLLLRQARDSEPPDFGGVMQYLVAPVDGSTGGTLLGPEFPLAKEGTRPDLSAVFTVDGSSVLVLKAGERLWTLPVDGSPGSAEPTQSADLPGMQRVLHARGATPCPGGAGCLR
jgi:hypothetical protein